MAFKTILTVTLIYLTSANSQYFGKPCKSQGQMLSEILASPNAEKALDVLRIAAGISNGVYPGSCGCNTCGCGCGNSGCSCLNNGCGCGNSGCGGACGCGYFEEPITVYNREVYQGTPFAQPVNCPCAGVPYSDIYPFLPNYVPAPIKSCQQAVQIPQVYSSIQQVLPGNTQVLPGTAQVLPGTAQVVTSGYPAVQTTLASTQVAVPSAAVAAPSTAILSPSCNCQSLPTALVNPLLPAQSPVSAIAPPTSNLFPPMTPKCFKSNFLRKIPIPPPSI